MGGPSGPMLSSQFAAMRAIYL
ncbi:DUF6053 domain-containing protein [Lysobacter enzymogenes]